MLHIARKYNRFEKLSFIRKAQKCYSHWSARDLTSEIQQDRLKAFSEFEKLLENNKV